jgi:DNA polymerase-1
VVAAFESKGLTEEDALVQARVARICRASDYDFKTKEVKLWNPPVTH